MELAGKTLGLIGVGKVGARVAQKARCLGMSVLAYDPYVPPEEVRKLGAEAAELDRLLERSDVLSVHVLRSPETAGMLGREVFTRVKRGVLLVNCARGGIVVEPDLLAALEEGRVGAAALDVYAQEPPVDRALVGHPRVVATPHIGAATREAQIVVAEMIAHQMGRFLTTGEAQHAVQG
jgi:D-3-phosphoglycerate dehydrogenase